MVRRAGRCRADRRSTCRSPRSSRANLLRPAISDSVQRHRPGGQRIGYIRLWAYTRDEVTRILYDELGNGPPQGRRRAGARPPQQMGRGAGRCGRDLRRRRRRHGDRRPRRQAQPRHLPLAQAGGRHHRRRHAQRHGAARLFAEEERRAAGRRADRRQRARRHRLSAARRQPAGTRGRGRLRRRQRGWRTIRSSRMSPCPSMCATPPAPTRSSMPRRR